MVLPFLSIPSNSIITIRSLISLPLNAQRSRTTHNTQSSRQQIPQLTQVKTANSTTCKHTSPFNKAEQVLQ